MDYFKEMSTRVFTILAICSFLGNSVVIFSNHWILDETTRYRMTTSVICGCDLIVKLRQTFPLYIHCDIRLRIYIIQKVARNTITTEKKQKQRSTATFDTKWLSPMVMSLFITASLFDYAGLFK